MNRFEDDFQDVLGSITEFEEIQEAQPDAQGLIEAALVPLRDMIIFPNMVTPLFVGRPRSLEAIAAAQQRRQTIICAAQFDPDNDDPRPDEIHKIGIEIAIGRMLRMPDGTSSVVVQGRRRVEIVEFTVTDPYYRVKARVIDEPAQISREIEARRRAVLALFEKVVRLNHTLPEDAYIFAMNLDDPSWLADMIATTLDITTEERQALLAIPDTGERLLRMSILLGKELDVLELEDKIHSRVQEEVDKSQREMFLREQMRAIQMELGEADVFQQEVSELRERLAGIHLPEAVMEKAQKELARLAAMPSMAPEVGIIRTYLDWLLELPWTHETEDNLDLAHVSNVLNEAHYGLVKAKDRILEHIAVRKLAPDKMKTPILCFAGPPGTGKTSIGRSIATALGRQFVRVSLGGVRDEAEIRGHRRTYIGALPGRIIQTMRRAGALNPVFMLDEIDKLGNDFRGDPSSALLEVLDPEQNSAFSDHYLEVDFDLSKVMFVTTANYLDPIPPALQDRLEVIEFSGYIEEEKLEIARQFLIPKELESHGLLDRHVGFETETLRRIIREYTYEAGVRNFEREIAKVCRKIARRVAEETSYPHRVTAVMLDKFLGPSRIPGPILSEQDEVGVSLGLAWTEGGGDLLPVEVTLVPGKGSLTLTGQLGDVMQESAQAALSYTRSKARSLGISTEQFESTDIHIHLPEGAIHKDGPSAGITLTLALISAFTGRPIRRDVAMTGEITLRGRVLPVGGIKEKVLAAHRVGIFTVIIPTKNKPDLVELPKRALRDLNILFAEHMDQVLEFALLPAPEKSTEPRKRRRVAARKPASIGRRPASRPQINA
jgi:ATP-dependent Lon protease